MDSEKLTAIATTDSYCYFLKCFFFLGMQNLNFPSFSSISQGIPYQNPALGLSTLPDVSVSSHNSSSLSFLFLLTPQCILSNLVL